MSARNEVTGQPYQGKNILRLKVAEAENGYPSSHGWAGFKQWLEVGRVVRKGEHGTACGTVMTSKDAEGRPTSKGYRGFRVFHYDQTTELKVSAPEVPAPVLQHGFGPS